jgi:Tfp pilus assembly protein PilE
MELIAAVAILMVLLAICLEILGAAAAGRRAAAGRQAAVLEAANVLERVAARPWDELEAEKAQLSPAARALLPEAELKIVVAAAPDEPEAKLITVSLRWQGSNSLPVPPVCLSAWRYRGARPTQEGKKTAAADERR